MIVIDFNSTPYQSFVSGFVKSLTAPYTVFSLGTIRYSAPIGKVGRSRPDSDSSIGGDFWRIGGDLFTAVDRYVKTQK